MDSEMSRSTYLPIEQTGMFRTFEPLADRVWTEVLRWTCFTRDTAGKQPVREIDSACAILVERYGGAADADSPRFFITARGFAIGSVRWMHRVHRRSLIEPGEALRISAELKAASKALNKLIAYRRQRTDERTVREVFAADPPSDHPSLDTPPHTPGTESQTAVTQPADSPSHSTQGRPS